MQRNRDFLLEHAGTLQSERLLSGPCPESVKVSARSFEELVKRTAELARGAVFYSDGNIPQGDWSDFFRKVYDYDTRCVRTGVIEAMRASGNVEPHLALLMAFFEQILLIQEDINLLTRRHLEFYYSDVLGFRKQESTQGKVTIFVNLKKNVPLVSLPRGTRFDAGKDSGGRVVEYVSTQDLVLGSEVLEHVGVFTPEGGLVPVPGGTASEEALLISSPVLRPQGDTVSLTLTAPDGVLSALVRLKAEYTGPQGWHPLKAVPRQGKDPCKWIIQEGAPPTVPYQAGLHGPGLSCVQDPVLRFTSPQGSAGALVSVLPSAIRGLTARVSGTRHFTLTSGEGTVENRAGAKPFGAGCKVGSAMEVHFPYPLDQAPELSPILRDTVSFSTQHLADPDTGKVLSSIVTLTDERCDQARLSDNYAKAVLRLMRSSLGTSKTKAGDGPDIDSVIRDGLVAMVPELSEPVTLSCSFTDSGPSRLLLTPFGALDVAASASAYGLIQPSEGKSCLYLGLRNLEPSTHLSLFFAILGDQDTPPDGSIRWELLEGSAWHALEAGRILRDTTGGMSQDGCVVLSLDGLDTAHATGLDGDCAWLRAVAQTENLRKVTSVRNHALEVAYSPASAGQASGGRALARGSITRPLMAIPGIRNVEQPSDGLPGTLEEDDVLFRLRVSEHLRHKRRAWSAWDYEHIILEAFPELAYCKCLAATGKDGENAPGSISLVLIPSSEADDLMPQPGTALLGRIRERIASACSPFVTVHLVGATFRPVGVAAQLVLRKGCTDTAGAERQVQKALREYLRSWIGDPGTGSHFNPGDSWSDVNNFLEQLPFVDYITSLDLYVDGTVTRDAVMCTSPGQIITSAELHSIRCSLSGVRDR